MKKILTKLFQHQVLSRAEAKDIMIRIAANEFNQAEIAAFISVFLMRSINVEEFLGFTDALHELCVDMQELQAYDPIDIVGTGGDNKNTFNISTLSCFVVAAAGYKVAKHGNYGSSSVSGASNVMENHGVKFTNEIDRLKRSLEESNIAYLHAPLFNDALKVVAPIRKSLGIRTFFNMLGPVCNPIRSKKSVLGVFNLKMARMYHYTYQQTDVDYSIVHNIDGYDEISLTDNFKVISRSGEKIYTPEEFNFRRYDQSELFGGDTPEEAAIIFRNVIDNRATEAQKNVVMANSAVAINTICPNKTINECILEAEEVISSGKLKHTFNKFLVINS